MQCINAGQQAPLIVQAGALLPPEPCKPHPPLGLQDRKPKACQVQLHAGDRVILYTDGIVESRSPDGEFFGERRLADFVSAAVASGAPTPETVRRLMRSLLAHQAGRLQDDASIVVLEWQAGAERRVLP